MKWAKTLYHSHSCNNCSYSSMRLESSVMTQKTDSLYGNRESIFCGNDDNQLDLDSKLYHSEQTDLA